MDDLATFSPGPDPGDPGWSPKEVYCGEVPVRKPAVPALWSEGIPKSFENHSWGECGDALPFKKQKPSTIVFLHHYFFLYSPNCHMNFYNYNCDAFYFTEKTG